MKQVTVGLERLHKLTVKLRDRLPLWVVYGPGTSDYPGRYVARMHLCLPEPRPTRFIIIGGDGLEKLREALPPGLERFERSPDDDRNIIEVWL